MVGTLRTYFVMFTAWESKDVELKAFRRFACEPATIAAPSCVAVLCDRLGNFRLLWCSRGFVARI